MRIFHSIFFIALGFTLVISPPVLFAKDKEMTIDEEATDFANQQTQQAPEFTQKTTPPKKMLDDEETIPDQAEDFVNKVNKK